MVDTAKAAVDGEGSPKHQKFFRLARLQLRSSTASAFFTSTCRLITFNIQ
jgi:hypothetical protein